MSPSRRFALKSLRLLTSEGLRPGAVLVDDGRITGVAELGEIPTDWSLDDAGDAVVMPGLVDSHVHINEPGRTAWEGFATATRAAAAGGMTTLVDMPLNSTPVTTSAAALQEKLNATHGQLTVDCAFWAGLVPGNLRELPALLDAGACGVKAFLVHSGIEDFPAAGVAELRPAMEFLARRQRPLLAHAELPDPNDKPWAPKSQDARSYRGRSYRGWLGSRPPAWEVRAIELLLRLCRATGCPLHIVHLATDQALPMLAAARAEGLPVTVETCPHYLFFAAEEIADGDTRFKCAPPIRKATTREGLWRALAEGAIDLIASDHSPAPAELKHLDDGDFAKAWGGIASLQLALPAVWTGARARGLDLAQIVAWMSTNPAKLAGLGQRKGRLAKGYDADLVVWRPESSFTVQQENLHHRHPITPYEGQTLYGVVERTCLRGRWVFEAGRFPEISEGHTLLRHE
jgi:allantoinase